MKRIFLSGSPHTGVVGATRVELTAEWGPKPVLSEAEGLHCVLTRTRDSPILSPGRCMDIIAALTALRNGFSGEGHRAAVGELQPTPQSGAQAAADRAAS